MALNKPTQNQASANASEKPAEFFLNITLQGKQLGYLVLDDFPQLVAALRANPDKATQLLLKCQANFRVRGEKRSSDFDMDALGL